MNIHSGKGTQIATCNSNCTSHYTVSTGWTVAKDVCSQVRIQLQPLLESSDGWKWNALLKVMLLFHADGGMFLALVLA